MIDACRRTGVPVIVGGRGFGLGGRWARRLGVPWAADATAAAALLSDDRALDPLPSGDLASLPVDEEYAALAAARTDLVAHCHARLESLFTEVRGYSPAQRDATLTDLGHIVDTLAAAVFVADGDLFDEFVEWLVEVLASRGVPTYTLTAALDALADRLRDFPLAHRILQARGPAAGRRPA